MQPGYNIREFPDDYVNPRKIPRVAFIENVEEILKSKGINTEVAMRQFQQQLSKYQLMDQQLTQSRAVLSNKMPEITKTIETLQFLQKRFVEEERAVDTSFGLTEVVFCSATCQPQKTVHLWLGANVMCEYTYDEALDMLETNLASARKNLEATLEDIAWVKDQVTVLEVNIARVYNFDVLSRRGKPAA